MDLFNHPACTDIIGAPSDMPEPACAALHVLHHTDQHGQWAISFWKPTDEEKQAIARGDLVALWVRASGRQHPVVGIGVEPYPTTSAFRTPYGGDPAEPRDDSDRYDEGAPVQVEAMEVRDKELRDRYDVLRFNAGVTRDEDARQVELDTMAACDCSRARLHAAMGRINGNPKHLYWAKSSA